MARALPTRLTPVMGLKATHPCLSLLPPLVVAAGEPTTVAMAVRVAAHPRSVMEVMQQPVKATSEGSVMLRRAAVVVEPVR